MALILFAWVRAFWMILIPTWLPNSAIFSKASSKLQINSVIEGQSYHFLLSGLEIGMVSPSLSSITSNFVNSFS